MLIMLAFLDRAARIGRLDLEDTKLRFGLFAVRDELRRSLIRGGVKYNRWFKYLDTTITRNLHNVRDINPALATVALIQFRKNAVIDSAYHEREAALKLPENRALADSYQKYISVLGEYLSSRHPYSLKFFACLMVLMAKPAHVDDIHASTDPNLSGQAVAPIFSLSPQTSTLLRYTMAPEANRVGIHVSVR
jgi:hypothetical protein